VNGCRKQSSFMVLYLTPLVLCFVYYREMAKRAAETYLTDQNFDEEQPKEEVEDLLLPCC